MFDYAAALPDTIQDLYPYNSVAFDSLEPGDAEIQTSLPRDWPPSIQDVSLYERSAYSIAASSELSSLPRDWPPSIQDVSLYDTSAYYIAAFLELNDAKIQTSLPRDRPPSIQDLYKLIEFQTFDGRFTLTDELMCFLGFAFLAETRLSRSEIEDDSVWATVYVMAYGWRHSTMSRN
ncbi:hypothetical protein BC937DRAFT_91966 [Endogone sp. FLAS-F59071]|nr:hypothetical protein BC937DRAFT_91966 [Endogone sp. FLAS-F59071]|eukprot:RUS15813.1 hypothetical protein BC937DRAFT_91966 [Endogone sp. FLAS-F59071]